MPSCFVLAILGGGAEFILGGGGEFVKPHQISSEFNPCALMTSNVLSAYSDRLAWTPPAIWAHQPSASGKIEENYVVMIRAVMSRREKKVRAGASNNWPALTDYLAGCICPYLPSLR